MSRRRVERVARALESYGIRVDQSRAARAEDRALQEEIAQYEAVATKVMEDMNRRKAAGDTTPGSYCPRTGEFKPYKPLEDESAQET